jgi:hypothetical protein
MRGVHLQVAKTPQTAHRQSHRPAARPSPGSPRFGLRTSGSSPHPPTDSRRGCRSEDQGPDKSEMAGYHRAAPGSHRSSCLEEEVAGTWSRTAPAISANRAHRSARLRGRRRGTRLRGGHQPEARPAVPVPARRGRRLQPTIARHLDQIGPFPAGLDVRATIGVHSLPLTRGRVSSSSPSGPPP